ncbi:LOW QUALITY PROTEIN: hypothetical protein HID58_054571, partial [Brassica napus]
LFSHKLISALKKKTTKKPMKMGRFEGFYLSGVLNSFLLFCNGGTTSRYVSRLEATADMPLDSDVFHVERSTAYQPWIWTVGSHELDFAPQIGETTPFKPFKHRYRTLHRSSGSTEQVWYSIKRGPAYIIVPASYSAYGKYTPEYMWLEQEFPKVNRTETPWLIVLLHSPWYNSYVYHYMEGETMRVMYEPWFIKNKILFLRVTSIAMKDQMTEPQPKYSAFREASFGHAIFSIKNRTHAYYGWHRNQDGCAVDEIMAAEHHVYLAVVEKKFRSCTIAGREEEMRRNEKSGLQRWKKRRAAKSKIISGDSLIIQTKPKRLINDTHLTPRRFSLTIKGKQKKFSIMANSSVLLGYLKTETVSRLVHRCNQNFRLSDLLLTVRYSDSTNLDVQNEPDSHIPEERFGDHDSLLGPDNTNTHLLVCLTHKRSLFRRNLKVVIASSINPKMVGVLLCHGGTTTSYVRRLEATADIPLDSDVFHVPPGCNAPQQVHITQEDLEGKAVIVTQKARGSNTVLYWKKHSKKMLKSHGKSKTYKFYNYTSGHIHHCTISNLEYYYMVGVGQTERKLWFLTPPKPGPDIPYTFGLI